MTDNPSLIESAAGNKADVISDTPKERRQGKYPRLIWPHLDSHQIFVRLNVGGEEVEAELPLVEASDWLVTLARAVARLSRQ